jgi:GTP-binding protein EngB required for normal cell division/gas vesicle protein
MKDNYFSWENLSEMADIQSHITYATTVLNRYNWDDSIKRSLKKQLDAIVAKQNDKVLNISVIGEFSTGKSSFINALVGHELLAVNVLQGTTVAITIIEYGASYSLSLVDKNGNSTTTEYKNINYLSSALQHYTTDPSYADSISHVRVTLPSDILKNGFRIIDTPGTNSLEQWHEEITRRAINDISDMSIILVDASRPMPETLVGFVESTLGNNVKDCLFVANKIDIIRSRERNGMLKFIQKKINLEFDIEGAEILPFASVALTNLFSKDIVTIDDDSKQLTFDSLQSIFSFTAQKRIKTQAKKLLLLIDNMYANLNANITHVAQQYQKELRTLEQSKQMDFRPFIAQQIALRQKRFITSAQEKKRVTDMETDNLVNAAIANINSKIDSHTTSTLDGLSKYIKEGELTSDIKVEGAQIANKTEKKFNQIKPIFNRQLTEFQSDFEKEFTRLKVLPIKFNVTPREVNVTHNANSANIGPVASLISDELSKENWAFGGGGAAGAAIGTAIMPGVGTAIGAFLGFVAGAFAAPDANEVKQRVKSKLNLPLRSYFRSICNDCMSNYTTYINDVNRSIEVEINRYYSTYNAEIQRRIDQWKAEHSKVQANIQRTRNEIVDINNRKSLILNIITRLNNL